MLEETKKKLKEEIGEEKANEVIEEAEKEVKSAISEKDQELQKHQKEIETHKNYENNLLENLKEVGYNEDEELTDFVNKLKEKIKEREDNKKNPKDTKENEKELDELRKQLKNLQYNYDKIEEEKKKQEAKNKENKIREQLKKAFSDENGAYTHYGADARIENLIYKDQLDVDKNGNVVWKKEDDPDIKIDFKEGLNKFLDKDEVKKDKKDTQKTGSDTKNTGGVNNNKSFNWEKEIKEQRKRIKTGIF